MRENVVLCEGETDTIWAAWQLADRNCEVFGLPTGAGQEPNKEQAEHIQDRSVWIMFDGDAAGRLAAGKWKSRLARGHIVEIPAGEDIVSCGVSVLKLLGLEERT